MFAPCLVHSFQWKDVRTIGEICVHLNIYQIGLRSGDILPAKLPSNVVANLIWNSNDSMIEINHVGGEKLMRIVGVTEVKLICNKCRDGALYSRKRIWCKCIFRPQTHRTIVSYDILMNDHDKQVIRYNFKTCAELFKFRTKCVCCRVDMHTSEKKCKLTCYMCPQMK